MTTSPHSRIPRFTAFDGLRGVLCLLVVVSHFPGETYLHGTRFHMNGGMFVDLFFVFSGFVIVHAFEGALASGYGTRRFLIERLGRFWPIHASMLLLFVLTEIAIAPLLSHFSQTGRAAFDGTNTPFAIVTNLLLIHSWGIHDTITWNYPAWSLSTEWAAYLFFALSIALGGGRFWPFALVGMAVSAFVLISVAPDHMMANHDYGVFRSILGFSVGAFALYTYRWLERLMAGRDIPKLLATVFEFLTLAAVIVGQMLYGLHQYGAFVLGLHFLLMLSFAFGRGHLSDFFSFRPFVYLGLISLSVYVVHAWILLRAINVATLLEKLFGFDAVRNVIYKGQQMTVFNLDRMGASMLALALIAVVVAVSHFTYRYIEMPGQVPFRRFAKRFKKEKAVAGATA